MPPRWMTTTTFSADRWPCCSSTSRRSTTSSTSASCAVGRHPRRLGDVVASSPVPAPKGAGRSDEPRQHHRHLQRGELRPSAALARHQGRGQRGGEEGVRRDHPRPHPAMGGRASPWHPHPAGTRRPSHRPDRAAAERLRGPQGAQRPPAWKPAPGFALRPRSATRQPPDGQDRGVLQDERPRRHTEPLERPERAARAAPRARGGIRRELHVPVGRADRRGDPEKARRAVDRQPPAAGRDEAGNEIPLRRRPNGSPSGRPSCATFWSGSARPGSRSRPTSRSICPAG